MVLPNHGAEQAPISHRLNHSHFLSTEFVLIFIEDVDADDDIDVTKFVMKTTKMMRQTESEHICHREKAASSRWPGT